MFSILFGSDRSSLNNHLVSCILVQRKIIHISDESAQCLCVLLALIIRKRFINIHMESLMLDLKIPSIMSTKLIFSLVSIFQAQIQATPVLWSFALCVKLSSTNYVARGKSERSWLMFIDEKKISQVTDCRQQGKLKFFV